MQQLLLIVRPPLLLLTSKPHGYVRARRGALKKQTPAHAALQGAE
jgi:hypothetical protein